MNLEENIKFFFYPDNLRHHNKLRYVMDYFGWEYTNNIDDDWNIAVFWDFNTDRKSPEFLLKYNKPIINYGCVTARKDYIDEIFKQVFGYTASIDPRYFYGYCIKKSVWQAVHDGKIIKCPVSIEENFVYQKIIDTRFNENYIMDIRVPVFKNIIPCVFKKIRPVVEMYGGVDRSKHKIKYYKNPNILLSEDEQEKLIKFCKLIPVEYCELDVLRNNWDSKIYVIDMNNTPSGGLFLTMGLGEKKTEDAISHYSEKFKEMFL
jgi:hypothetical protein